MLSQYFRGYLAGLSVLKGKTESDRVIQCLNNCKEKLDFHAMSEMETGMVGTGGHTPCSRIHRLFTNCLPLMETVQTGISHIICQWAIEHLTIQ